MKMKLVPYITLEGRAKEAIQFYKEVFHAEVLSSTTYGEMPGMSNTFTEELKDLVAHAKLKIGDTELMLSDAPAGSLSLGTGNRVTICITTHAVEHARDIYEALRQGGQVNMPFSEEAFSPGFGDVTDPFGVTFQIYTEIETF
ncbi:VOC family protein [Paenibacillus sp. F411]|uniref:VOC family protein n=1 Tax=Paenibacillus sp. F411 TaxID=2820239 RepID=UPI001AAE485F|nr:VOC family protein [Paenibacillus sp. F411]MBO2944539.1 VOC family protein [Paenibacillus sp. F411]